MLNSIVSINKSIKFHLKLCIEKHIKFNLIYSLINSHSYIFTQGMENSCTRMHFILENAMATNIHTNSKQILDYMSICVSYILS